MNYCLKISGVQTAWNGNFEKHATEFWKLSSFLEVLGISRKSWRTNEGQNSNPTGMSFLNAVCFLLVNCPTMQVSEGRLIVWWTWTNVFLQAAPTGSKTCVLLSLYNQTWWFIVYWVEPWHHAATTYSGKSRLQETCIFQMFGLQHHHEVHFFQLLAWSFGVMVFPSTHIRYLTLSQNLMGLIYVQDAYKMFYGETCLPPRFGMNVEIFERHLAYLMSFSFPTLKCILLISPFNRVSNHHAMHFSPKPGKPRQAVLS